MTARAVQNEKVVARWMGLLVFVPTTALERVRRRRHAGPVVDKPLGPSGQ